jgi:AcrR family transcriptional regulator
MPAARRRRALDRDAWVAEARAALIAGGIAAVRIGQLARRLAVTREAFYWHFDSLADLHAALLRDWAEGNSAAYRAPPTAGRQAGARAFRRLAKAWLSERRYDPGWDAAVRDWARTSKAAARKLAEVDRHRIEVLRRMFVAMGFEEVEALIRARITYFHQVGYYAIDLGEAPSRRARLAPVYVRILTGRRILG